MLPLTIFLAKFLGLYCIIVALAGMITRKQKRRRNGDCAYQKPAAPAVR